jgi:RimJ/RimL family protein N-acetyltransferase
VIADKVSDAALGTASVDIEDERTGVLGYWLGRAYWGRGLMKEAVAALLRHAEGYPFLRRLRAAADPVRSQRVLSACGLSDCGLADRERPSRRGSTQVRRYELVIKDR